MPPETRQEPIQQNLEGQPRVFVWVARLINLSMDSAWRNILLGAALFALFYLIANLLINWSWIDQPFAGFLHQNRVVTFRNLPGSDTHHHKTDAAELEDGYVILEVAGQPVPDSSGLTLYLRRQKIGKHIIFTLLNNNGQSTNASLDILPFTRQNFVQLVAIPAFLAFITLLVSSTLTYLRPDQFPARLFAMFGLALVIYLGSFPEFMTNGWYPLNFVLAYFGKIVMPALLLHFTLIYPQPRRVTEDWPFLLPLIYLPILPAFIQSLTLFSQPETTYTFNLLLNSYAAVYAVIGVLILISQAADSSSEKIRNQIIVLIAGIALPTLLLFTLILIYPSVDVPLVSDILDRYGFVGVPIAVSIAVIQYEMFQIQLSNRSIRFYISAIGLAIAGYLSLFTLVNPVSLGVDQFQSQDIYIISITTIIFFLGYLLLKSNRNFITEIAFGSDAGHFDIGVRILSSELLKVKTRRGLERLVGWEIASDFGLHSAELVSGRRPTAPYALQLPLTVSNVFLGSLFLGEKINGKPFNSRELRIIEQIKKQVSLILWSIELDEAITRTEELTELKSKFLANVTHELRAPLNGIINYIGFVLDDFRHDLNPEQQAHLEQALQGAEKLLQIINNILDMSKIEADQMSLHVQTTDLSEIMLDSSRYIEHQIGNKPVTLITEIAPDLPLLQGDRLRLRQIIVNMLSNAVKFTQSGTIHLSAYSANGNVVVKVTDTGTGINKKVLPTIFEQFISADLTDADQNFGPGLSMPITKSLVELHGGQVDVDSSPGEGTTFTVTLPVSALQKYKEGVI